jgi:hypothetical protein
MPVYNNIISLSQLDNTGTSSYVLTAQGAGNAPQWAAASGGTTANALASATTTVNVSSATAPTSGQVLTATSGTAATWQSPGSYMETFPFCVSAYPVSASAIVRPYLTGVLIFNKYSVTINSITIYIGVIGGSSNNILAGFYTTAGALVGSGTTSFVPTVTGFKTLSFASGVTLSALTPYYLCVATNSGSTSGNNQIVSAYLNLPWTSPVYPSPSPCVKDSTNISSTLPANFTSMSLNSLTTGAFWASLNT